MALPQRGLLIGMLVASLGVGEALAQSRSSVSLGDKTITVTGGGSQSVSTAGDSAILNIDGRVIRVDGTIINLEGRTADLGPYRAIEIFVQPTDFRVVVDGRVLVMPQPRAIVVPAPPPPSSLPPVESAQVERAVRLFYGDGVPQDIPEAVRLLTVESEAGDPTAQRNLGLLYRAGAGVAPNDDAALNWLGRAALGGDSIAQDALSEMIVAGRGSPSALVEIFNQTRQAALQGSAQARGNLGYAYEFGVGTEPNAAEALRWYRTAAEDGDPVGQFNFGLKLLGGIGVPKDETVAVGWLRLAAEQGYAPAYNTLGYAYDNGLGVPQDQTEAVRLYTIAAEQGVRFAQLNLGASYEQGSGVPRDIDAALRWYLQAADQGDLEASAAIERLGASRTSAQPTVPTESIATTTPPISAVQSGASPGAGFWVELNGQPRGPMALEAVLGLLESGRITGNSLIWHPGLTDWMPLSSLSQ